MALSNRPFGGAIFLRLSSKWPFDLIGLSNDGESGKSESSCFAGWFLFGQNLNWGASYISKSVRIQPRIDVDLYHKYWVVWLSKVQLLFVKFTFDLEWNWNNHWHISLLNWTDRRLYIQDEICCCQNIRRPIWVFPKTGVPPKHPKTHGCWVPPFLETPISCQIFFWLLFWLKEWLAFRHRVQCSQWKKRWDTKGRLRFNVTRLSIFAQSEKKKDTHTHTHIAWTSGEYFFCKPFCEVLV